MKAHDTLVEKITNIKQGIKFIKFLIKNNMMFHLDDDVAGILWKDQISKGTINLIHQRHQELWKIGNPWKYADKIITKYLKEL